MIIIVFSVWVKELPLIPQEEKPATSSLLVYYYIDD